MTLMPWFRCYGTVPVVRATGGLADTVQDFDPSTESGTGFCFDAYEYGAFRDAIVRAVEVWNNKTLWRTLMKNGMASDFSWTRSAHQYLDAYEKFAGSL